MAAMVDEVLGITIKLTDEQASVLLLAIDIAIEIQHDEIESSRVEINPGQKIIPDVARSTVTKFRKKVGVSKHIRHLIETSNKS